MKEKRFQNLSLALNAVLLIALFATRAELVDKQTILKSKLDDIAYRLSDMDDQIRSRTCPRNSGSRRRICRIFPLNPPAWTRKAIRCKPT